MSDKGSQGRHHKSKQSLARGLKHLRLDSSLNTGHPSAGISPSIHSRLPGRSSTADSAISVDSSWDVVEDLPLRWATDYVPLAAPGTRLFGTSVQCYDMWRDPIERSRGVAYLAVVVKSNILLYHAPKGERAFRFVKVAHPTCTSYNASRIHIFVLGILYTHYCAQYHIRSTSRARLHVAKPFRRHPANAARR